VKSEVMVELLETAAEQLGVRVSYEALQTVVQTGLRGGLCKVKGEWRLIVDKRATAEERVATIATCLGRFDVTALEMPAPVRACLRTHEPSSRHRSTAA
jgi:hypothetical protein